MMDSTRINAIDYVKCIGIIAVLLGHFPNNITNVIKPYTFHMPLFFLLGGLLFTTNKGYYKHFKNVFSKYFIYIVISYILLALFVDFSNHIFGTQKLITHSSGFYETIKLIMKNNLHNNTLFMVGWFLFSYMLVLIVAFPLYSIIERFTDGIAKTLVSLVLGISFGYIAINYVSPEYKSSGVFYLNTLCQTMVGLMFFMCGYSAKNYIWKILNPTIAFTLLLLVASLRDAGLIKTLYMSWSTYGDGFVMSLIGAFSGIYITFFFADLLSKSGDFKVLKLVGMNSKSIMTFHLLCFTILDVLLDYLGLFTIDGRYILKHFEGPYAFPLYMFFSIILSIIIGKSLQKLTKGVYQ